LYRPAAERPTSNLPDDYEGPPRTVSETHTAREAHHDASVFVRDVTIPDGTEITRGTPFVKTWEIQNAGTMPWVGRRLARVTPRGNTFPSSPASVPISDAMPGSIVQISVELTTSHVEGWTETRFKMIDAEGALCFPGRYAYGLTVVIVTQGTRGGV
ncbi:MAG: NBR1-Ig-like domain-containing protein, partial [Aeromicrobium sp.]